MIGWVIAGYLGATLFGMTFGTRGRVLLRLGALAGVALVVGLGGALLAKSLGGLPGPWLGLSLLGALIVASVGAVTVALQAVLRDRRDRHRDPALRRARQPVLRRPGRA